MKIVKDIITIEGHEQHFQCFLILPEHRTNYPSLLLTKEQMIPFIDYWNEQEPNTFVLQAEGDGIVYYDQCNNDHVYLFAERYEMDGTTFEAYDISALGWIIDSEHYK